MRERTTDRNGVYAGPSPGRVIDDGRDITRIVPAWLCDRRNAAVVARRARSEGPQLRLQVVQDEGDALAVQVAEGDVPARDALLYVGDRGVFGVATLLRRQSGGGPRTYVRLRAWQPPACVTPRRRVRGR